MVQVRQTLRTTAAEALRSEELLMREKEAQHIAELGLRNHQMADSCGPGNLSDEIVIS